MGDLPLDRVICADCMDPAVGLPSLPDGCVDLVLADPLYDDLSLYANLEALNILSSDGNGLAFTNAKWLAQCLRGMYTELPVLAYLNANGAAMNGRIIAKSHFLVWWGSGKLQGYMPDGWLSTPWSAPYKHEHRWVKNPKYYYRLLSAFTKPGDLVIDPCCGSGTTAVACIQTGRHFIGYEINPEYCEIAEKRIAEAQAQPRLDLNESIPKPTTEAMDI